MKKLIVILAFVLVGAYAQTKNTDVKFNDNHKDEKPHVGHDHDDHAHKHSHTSLDGKHAHVSIDTKADTHNHESLDEKHDNHNHSNLDDKRSDHETLSDKHDNHGHDHDEAKHDDHAHDGHGHGDEDGHAHGGSKAVGEGKAIKELDEEKGISFSKEAMLNLKIKLRPLSKSSISIPKVALVYSRNQKAVYVLRAGYFKMEEVSVLKVTKNSYSVKLKHFEVGDKIVMSDVNLIRVSDIYAKDKSEYGHSH